MPEIPLYQSEAEIEEVVRRFESCEYKPEEFVHSRHLTVAAWYLLESGQSAATQRMRDGLLRFTAYHGKSGYHETITGFWLRAVACHVRELLPTRQPVEIVNEIVAVLSDKNLVFRHYSRDAIASAEAKSNRTEPDLLSFPGGF
jgi:hypothetical protein